MLPWIRKFPVKALQKRGHIPHETCGTGVVLGVLRFMGIAGPAGFEKSYGYALGTAAPQTYAAWIRQGETLVSCGSARITNKIVIDRELLVYNLKALRRNATGNLRASIATALRDCGISFIEVEPFVTAPYPSCAAYWVGERPVIQVPTTRMTDSALLENLCRAAWHIVTKSKRSTFLAAPPAGQRSVAVADCDPDCVASPKTCCSPKPTNAGSSAAAVSRKTAASAISPVLSACAPESSWNACSSRESFRVALY
jgi:hypothetical protein